MGPVYQIIFFSKIGPDVQATSSFLFSYLQGILSIEYFTRQIIDVTPVPSQPVPTPMHYAVIYFSIKTIDSVFLKVSCIM